MDENVNVQQPNVQQQGNTKFCKNCGQKIDEKAVICPHCGCQVEEIKNAAQPSVVINNSNSNVANATAVAMGGAMGNPKNKWVALVLLIFLGFLGGHKFYEGKAGMGILYLLTGGLFCIGLIVDLIVLIGRPNPYYVYK